MRKGYMGRMAVAKVMLAALACACSGNLHAQGGAVAQAPASPAAAAVKPETLTQGGAIIREKDGVTAQDVARKAGVSVQDSAVKFDKAAVSRKVEAYFNGLTSLQADFSQSVTGEAFASEGTFYLKRPRNFLWQYETPVRQKIVNTGAATYYVDQSTGKDGQVTQMPNNAGLGRLFGARTLTMKAAGLEVAEVEETAGTLKVLLKIAKPTMAEDQAGLRQAWLTFDKLDGGKLELRRIEALDTLQATTVVTFSNVRHGLALDDKLFRFTPGVYQNAN